MIPMATETRSEFDNLYRERVREIIDDHRWSVFFVVFELFLVVAAYLLDAWSSFVIGGVDLTDLTAGLLGAFAVVAAIFGVVAVLALGLSKLWLIYSRR